MRRAAVMTVVSLLAACGGGSGSGNNNNNNNNNNGTVRSFSYGTPAAATPAQQGTATTAQTQLNGVVTATHGGQVINASGAPTLTDTLAASLPALLAVPDPAEAEADPAGPVAAVRRSSALSGNCISVNGSTINYNNCSLSEPGYTISLNGSLSSTSNAVTWTLTETYSYSASGYTLNGNANWGGTLQATGSTITGNGRSTYHYTGNYQNVNVSYDYTAAIDINLSYSASPFCINGGTLEIRRVVTTNNGGSAPVHDAALKFTWTACNTYTVQKGT